MMKTSAVQKCNIPEIYFSSLQQGSLFFKSRARRYRSLNSCSNVLVRMPKNRMPKF